MVVEAGQFCFRRLLDRAHSNSPTDGKCGRLLPLSMLEDPAALKDLSNLKQRMMPTYPDKRLREELLGQKEDLHRIRMELCRQIQRDTGRTRIENLEVFQKLERKDQRDMRLEAKTILLSIKKESKFGEKIIEPLSEKSPPKKKVGMSDTSLAVLNPLRLASTIGIMERLSKSNSKTVLASSKHLTDSVVERRESRTAMRGGMESVPILITEDNPRRQSIDRQPFTGIGNGLHIMNSAKSIKRKGGSMQLQMNKFSHCEKMEKYRAFLSKVNFANSLSV